jgi:hypothetical protein
MLARLQLLAKPLSQRQIEAAGKFWVDNEWGSEEIGQLKQCFPQIRDAITLKAVALNTLYSAGVIAIVKVAGCLESRLKLPSCPTGPELVEELVTEIATITRRKHYVFVAKYCHFFVNPNLPILDYYAEWMVGTHLGPSAQSQSANRYLKFDEDIKKLKECAGLACDCDQLDAYLWTAGEYWRWKQNPKRRINGELKAHFERLGKNPDTERRLAELLGITAGNAVA